MVTRTLLRDVMDAVLPQRCIACRRFGAALHRDCLGRLPAAEGPRCERCWRPGVVGRCDGCVGVVGSLTAVRAPFRFEGIARLAILEVKFGGVTALVEPLAKATAEVIPLEWLDGEPSIAPVPLHSRRRRQRGFNQAELLARELGRLTGLEVRADLVRRTRVTAPQAGLTAAERWRNVVEVFEVRRGERPLPAAVIVVDDVTTTGATLDAVGSALRSSGVGRVYGLTLARED